jgi:methyl-CpG-binding domain protein 4
MVDLRVQSEDLSGGEGQAPKVGGAREGVPDHGKAQTGADGYVHPARNAYRATPAGKEMSPYCLFQERYDDDGWKLLCCTICLNLCSGRAFESIHEDLFALWSSPYEMAAADALDLEAFLSPLGLQRRRARSLIRMSTAYAFLWDGRDPTHLPGIGKYGSDSYRIFVRGETKISVEDKELKKYLAWLASFPKP